MWKLETNQVVKSVVMQMYQFIVQEPNSVFASEDLLHQVHTYMHTHEQWHFLSCGRPINPQYIHACTNKLDLNTINNSCVNKLILCYYPQWNHTLLPHTHPQPTASHSTPPQPTASHYTLLLIATHPHHNQNLSWKDSVKARSRMSMWEKNVSTCITSHKVCNLA